MRIWKKGKEQKIGQRGTKVMKKKFDDRRGSRRKKGVLEKKI